MKKIIIREVILAYPNFNKTFLIYTDTRTQQLGVFITPKNIHLDFYTKKY